jgi:hypothetical protein
MTSPSAPADSAAGVLLAPAGWRSVVQVPEGGEIAFWKSRTRLPHSSDLGLG